MYQNVPLAPANSLSHIDDETKFPESKRSLRSSKFENLEDVEVEAILTMKRD